MIKQDYDKNERIYDLLSQDSYFILNRKLNSSVGLVLGAFLVFLLDKEKYHKYNGELTPDGYFYATDMDIMLMTGLSSSQVKNLKKSAVEKEFVFTKKEGIPLKTYYKVNLQKINDIINLNKSATELSYERIIDEEGDISSLLNVSENTLSNLTFRDLRFICKKFRVPYSGKNTKQEMIEKILEEKEKALGKKDIENTAEEKEREILSIQDLKSLTFKNLRLLCKESNISYCGQDTKDILIMKIADIKGFLEESYKTNEEKNIDVDIDFEKIFNEFKIAYTLKNQNSIKKLQKTMSNKEIKNYLTETYENIKKTEGVKDFAALFSAKIAKGERQIIIKSKSEEKNTKDLLPEKEDTTKTVTKGNTEKENLIKVFENLTEDKKLYFEEKAINLCCERNNFSTIYLKEMKEKHKNTYYLSIKPFLIEILEKELKKVS